MYFLLLYNVVYLILEHDWQFFVCFLYGASVHLNRRSVYLIGRFRLTNKNAQNGLLGEFCAYQLTCLFFL